MPICIQQYFIFSTSYLLTWLTKQDWPGTNKHTWRVNSSCHKEYSYLSTFQNPEQFINKTTTIADRSRSILYCKFVVKFVCVLNEPPWLTCKFVLFGGLFKILFIFSNYFCPSEREKVQTCFFFSLEHVLLSIVNCL